MARGTLAGVGTGGAAVSELGAKAFTAFNTSRLMSVSSGELPVGAEAGAGAGAGAGAEAG